MRTIAPPPTKTPLTPAPEKGVAPQVSFQWGAWFSSVTRAALWQEVASFSNSWANAGGAYYNAAYHQDIFGVVRLRGRIGSGSTGTAAFTLPKKFRPGATMNFAVAGGTVSITTGGVVTPTGTTLDLDNINFIAEA